MFGFDFSFPAIENKTATEDERYNEIVQPTSK